MDIIMFILGFFILVKSANIFVEGCSNFSKFLKIPSIIIGLTVVAFGTSMPETAVSLIASLNGENTISIGNVVGSNICNILLVLGLSSLFGVLSIRKEVLFRDYTFNLLVSFLLFIIVLNPFLKGFNISVLSKINGFIFILLLIFYLIILIKNEKENSILIVDKVNFNIMFIIYIIVGLIGIILGGNIVVNNALEIAEILGVSKNVIALTMVAVGTSLPEVVTSIVATKKGEIDIAIGNVIGSNIFNILFILGLSSIVGSLKVTYESFIDIILMLIFSLIVFFILLKDKKITKVKGIFLLIIYFIYILYILGR